MLQRARHGDTTVQSNVARALAGKFAEAASRGWITTKIDHTLYGKVWLLTAAGSVALEWFYQETTQ